MIQKQSIIPKLNLNQQQISLDAKIRLLKTFYLPYTEIFAQILESTDENTEKALKCQQNAIKEQLQIYKYEPTQLSLFTGIPYPIERWTVIKLQFYWKLLRNKEITYLHKWARMKEINESYELLKQFEELKTKWCNNTNDKETDTFLKANNCHEIRKEIIQKQNEEKIRKLHNKHPFKKDDSADHQIPICGIIFVI